MTTKTTARIVTEVFTANIHHATSISRTMENTQSRERRATANAAKEWEWSKNIRGRKEQMDKKEILDILDNAKDERGAVPMRLVRQAFDKLPTIQPVANDTNDGEMQEMKQEFLRMAGYIDVLLECSDEQKETLLGFISRMSEFMPWTQED